MLLIIILIASVAGVARTVSRMVSAQLAERIGSLQSTFFNYLVGLGCAALALGVSREPWLLDSPLPWAGAPN